MVQATSWLQYDLTEQNDMIMAFYRVFHLKVSISGLPRDPNLWMTQLSRADDTLFNTWFSSFSANSWSGKILL
jgi:hypothetical protein